MDRPSPEPPAARIRLFGSTIRLSVILSLIVLCAAEVRALPFGPDQSVAGSPQAAAQRATRSSAPLSGLGGRRGARVLAIDDVACPSASICYAVGTLTARTGRGTGTTARPSPDGSTRAVVVRSLDGGRSWQDRFAGGAAEELDGVSCSSTQNCHATGVVTAPGGSRVPAIFATTDAGATWHREGLPAGTGDVLGISCPSAERCIAIGRPSVPTSSGSVLIVTSDGGASWYDEALAPVWRHSAVELSSISCSGAGRCSAVGEDQSGAEAVAIAVSPDGFLDGGRLVVRGLHLSEVSCSGVGCIAVGTARGGPGGTSTAVVVGSQNAFAGWRYVVALPRLDHLTGASCTAGGACVAVGYRVEHGLRAALVYSSPAFGASWSQRQMPGAGGLSMPQCPAPGDCVAFASPTEGGSAGSEWGSRPRRLTISP